MHVELRWLDGYPDDGDYDDLEKEVRLKESHRVDFVIFGNLQFVAPP